MGETSPILLWFRRDLRLSDHEALSEAAASGRPVIPVFLCDEVVEGHGAAPKWRLGLGVAALSRALEEAGSRLVLRRGDALPALRKLVAETSAGAVWWSRLHDPDARRRDTAVKAGLKADGIAARSFPGHVLFEPWTVATGQGGFYRVYTPYWKAVRGRDVGAALPAPGRIAAPGAWPESESLDDWHLGAAMDRGAAVVAGHVNVGEARARGRLGAFIAEAIDLYAERRDFPAAGGTSRLSENLTYGEISPRTCWLAGMRAREEGKRGAETFLKELAWREFAHHLVHHTPEIVEKSWREEWRGFPWEEDARRPEIRAWKRARTGVPFVDAGLREMQVTGTMHNRVRMVAASYLTKHLMAHWRVGQSWFEEHLTDWDPASNALGWQWVAGSGPDAAPYFRVFNPETQGEKFDAEGAYRRAWIAEGQESPPATARAFFEAIPRRWNLAPGDAYPAPVVGLGEGRERALAAYRRFKG